MADVTGPIHKHEPDPEKLLKLPPLEIAPYLFEYLLATAGTSPFSRKNVFANNLISSDYTESYRPAVSLRLMAAWGLLERLGAIVQSPSSDDGWYTFSAWARQLGNADRLKTHIEDHFTEPSAHYAELNQDIAEKVAAVVSAKTDEAIAFIDEYERKAKE